MAFMTVNGLMIKSMAMVNLHFPMAIFTKEIIPKVTAKEKVYSNCTMEIYIKVNFIAIKSMVKGNLSNLILKIFSRAHGRMIVLLVK